MSYLSSNEIKAHDLSPALLRQRRNLLIVSILLLFLTVSGANLNKITFVGIEMSFQNPRAIFWFLYIFLGYFFYRYGIYLAQEPKNIKNTFFNTLTKRTTPKIKQIRNELFPGSDSLNGQFDLRYSTKTSFFKRQLQLEVGTDGLGGLIIKDVEINLSKFWFDYIVTIIYIFFTKSYFTDYFLPIFVALCAIAVSLVPNIATLLTAHLH